jgi:hypothetical protein
MNILDHVGAELRAEIIAQAQSLHRALQRPPRTARRHIMTGSVRAHERATPTPRRSLQHVEADEDGQGVAI